MIRLPELVQLPQDLLRLGEVIRRDGLVERIELRLQLRHTGVEGLRVREGLAGLSMRRLASALKVEAMSLYNHVKDKQDLLGGMADHVLSGITPPDPALPWSERLEAVIVRLYQSLVAHPALVLVLASEQGRITDLRVLQGIDAIVGTLAESGMSPEHQVNAYRGMIALCFGFVLAHTLGLSASKTEAQQAWERDPVEWDPGALPHLAALGPQFLKTHADDDFRFMLGAYLDALERVAAPVKPARRRRPR